MHSRTTAALWLVASATVLIVWRLGVTPLRSAPKSSPAMLPGEAARNLVQDIPLEQSGTGLTAGSQRMPLVLTSTVAGRNAREGTAALGLSIGNAQTYEANALLPNGARLLEIHAEYVVLERDDHKVTLNLAAQSPLESVDALDAVLTVTQPSSDAPISAPALPPLTAVVHSRPIYEGEEFIGMRVDPGPDATTFAALGLLPGDIVVAIADEPVDRLNSLIESIAERGTLASSVQLSLLRNERSRQQTFDLNVSASKMARAMSP